MLTKLYFQKNIQNKRIKMELHINNNNLTIFGNIKTVFDAQEIKKNLDVMTIQHRHINIHIPDSISMTSAVIGYLNKLVLKDGISLYMYIKCEQLLNLLRDLKLGHILNTRKLY